MRINDMSSDALDIVISVIEGCTEVKPYSRDWSLMGPLIQKHGLELKKGLHLWASLGYDRFFNHVDTASATGATALLAAARCYVCLRVGSRHMSEEYFIMKTEDGEHVDLLRHYRPNIFFDYMECLV